MVTIVRYHPKYKPQWDQFVAASKNGIFLFYRDYMDYHADRFTDHSLLFFDKDTVVAVMPANVKETFLVSHGGLTFGGILSDSHMKMPLMLEIFGVLVPYLKARGFTRAIYKPIPHIYHSLPAEEDLYALFIHKARLVGRDVSSTIVMKDKLSFSKGRRGCIKKAQRSGLTVARSDDFKTFLAIEDYVLRTYHNQKPVHTAAEMQLLASRFPENIKLFATFRQEVMLGGVIVYESQNVAHAQYISATDEGKQLGATDLVLDFLLREYYAEKIFFDFGISTERQGEYLNAGLMANKESFGARTTVYDFYELDLTH